MDIALKRKKFELQIRKHNRIAFIQKRTAELSLATKVNNIFSEFLHQSPKTIPLPCVLHFHLLAPQPLTSWLLTHPNLNLYKPQNIHFLTKLTNSLNIIFPEIFVQTIQIASNLTLTLKTNEELLSPMCELGLRPSEGVRRDLRGIFGAYLEFWAVFWRVYKGEVAVKHYVLVVTTVIQWYNNQQLVQCLSPFSIIQFILSYLTVDEYFQFNMQNQNGVVQIYELNHKFATSIVHILDSLISKGFFSIEVVKIIQKIVDKPNHLTQNLLHTLLDNNLIFTILQKGLEPTIPSSTPSLTPDLSTHPLPSPSQLTYHTLSLMLTLSNTTSFQIKFFQYKPVEFVGMVMEVYRFYGEDSKREREIRVVGLEVLFNLVVLVGQVGQEDQWGEPFEGCEMVVANFKTYFQKLSLLPLIQDTLNANSTIIVCFLQFLTMVCQLVNSEQFAKKTIIQSCLIPKLQQKLNQNLYDQLQIDNLTTSLIQLLTQSSRILPPSQLHPLITHLTSSVLTDYLTNSQRKYLLELIEQQQIEI